MFTIKKNIPEANISRTIRFSESLFEELNKTATENDVSFNTLVLQCCRYALDELGNEKDETDKAE